MPSVYLGISPTYVWVSLQAGGTIDIVLTKKKILCKMTVSSEQFCLKKKKNKWQDKNHPWQPATFQWPNNPWQKSIKNKTKQKKFAHTDGNGVQMWFLAEFPNKFMCFLIIFRQLGKYKAQSPVRVQHFPSGRFLRTSNKDLNHKYQQPQHWRAWNVHQGCFASQIPSRSPWSHLPGKWMGTGPGLGV